jgi:hypothetical protein
VPSSPKEPVLRLKGAGPNRTLVLVASIAVVLLVIAVAYVLILAPR